MGCTGLLAGAAGVSLWINDGSHYFDLAVALASAGLLTLISCVLTRVFGSSHGSQDDAFRRGREMGYDAGFLEGHRTARPVVVPLHAIDSRAIDSQAIDSDVDDEEDQSRAVRHIGGFKTSETREPFWRRNARHDVKARVGAWVGARRIPLLAGALCIALVGVVFTSAALRKPLPAGTLNLAHGPLFYRVAPALGATPTVVGKPAAPPARVAAVAGASQAAPAAGAVAAPVAAPGAVALAVPADSYLPAVASGVAAPRPAPVAAAPAVPLTAAQQTAADAAAAAALTAANAKAAADLTAANAAAAAEATRRQAAADAWAVAHPNP
jgi:hypothetical protein